MPKKQKKSVFEEERVKKKLVILTVVFVVSFLAIISLLFEEIKKINYPDSSKVDKQLAQEISRMVKGYPIEKMVPEIATKDRRVAAYLVSIAKKESNWGKRVPVLNGRDCYNYWGFRAKGGEVGSGGHTCFRNRRQAVNAVSERIEELINEYNLDSPEKLIVWKCGSSCDGHSNYSVQKWISDVSFYYNKIVN